MSKPTNQDKDDEYLKDEIKPWEKGFEFEEAEQKAKHRARKGDKADAIKDTSFGK